MNKILRKLNQALGLFVLASQNAMEQVGPAQKVYRGSSQFTEDTRLPRLRGIDSTLEPNSILKDNFPNTAFGKENLILSNPPSLHIDYAKRRDATVDPIVAYLLVTEFIEERKPNNTVLDNIRRKIYGSANPFGTLRNPDGTAREDYVPMGSTRKNVFVPILEYMKNHSLDSLDTMPTGGMNKGGDSIDSRLFTNDSGYRQSVFQTKVTQAQRAHDERLLGIAIKGGFLPAGSGVEDLNGVRQKMIDSYTLRDAVKLGYLPAGSSVEDLKNGIRQRMLDNGHLEAYDPSGEVNLVIPDSSKIPLDSYFIREKRVIPDTTRNVPDSTNIVSLMDSVKSPCPDTIIVKGGSDSMAVKGNVNLAYRVPSKADSVGTIYRTDGTVYRKDRPRGNDSAGAA